MGSSPLTWVEHHSLTGDTRAVVVHGHDLNGVADATREVVQAVAEVRGLPADVAIATVGRH